MHIYIYIHTYGEFAKKTAVHIAIDVLYKVVAQWTSWGTALLFASIRDDLQICLLSSLRGKTN